MNTLHDLRSTLDRHADDLDDTERYARPSAVRARVRGVRRRRAGIVSVAAAAVLLAGVATVNALNTPDSIQPADRVVVGVDVPGGVDVLGFPYQLRELHDLTDDAAHVNPTDHDDAVLLAASGLGSGSATLYADGQAVARVSGDQQVAAPYPVGDGGTTLEVRLDGTDAGARAGAAVYEATGELAPGVDNGTAVFRDEVSGDMLVAAGFSSADQQSVELDVPSSGRALRFVFYCTAPDDLWITASIDGEDGPASSCGNSGPDAGVGTSSTFRIPAGDHHLRVHLTDGADGPEVAPPDDAVIGAGVYEVDGSGRAVLGQAVPPRVEYAGRTWQLYRVEAAPVEVAGPDDLLLGVVGQGDEVRAAWSGRLSHGETPRASSPDDAALTFGSILLTGDQYAVELEGGEGKVLVYRPE